MSCSPSFHGSRAERVRPSSRTKTVCRQSADLAIDELDEVEVDEDDVYETSLAGGRDGCEGPLAIKETTSESW